jgi:hypothetical protein
MNEYFSDRTRNLIAVLIALCFIAAVGAITYGAITANRLSEQGKQACIAEGGVFTNGVCAWSKP